MRNINLICLILAIFISPALFCQNLEYHFFIKKVHSILDEIELLDNNTEEKSANYYEILDSLNQKLISYTAHAYYLGKMERYPLEPDSAKRVTVLRQICLYPIWLIDPLLYTGISREAKMFYETAVIELMHEYKSNVKALESIYLNPYYDYYVRDRVKRAIEFYKSSLPPEDPNKIDDD